MFEVKKSMMLVTTASALNNNLAIEGLEKTGFATSVAVIHGGWVNMIPFSKTIEIRDKYIPIVPPGTRPKKVTSTVSQVLWLSVGEDLLFVTTSSLGVHVFEREGRILLYSHPCNTGDKEKPNGNYASCATAMDNKLFVGDNCGTIRVFEVYLNSEDAGLIQEQKAHASLVSDLACSIDDKLVVSADVCGLIVVWSFRGKLQQIIAIDGYSTPCNSIQLWQGLIIAGYGSGHIRCFTVETGHILFEVGAHARTITALDVSQVGGFLLSVSEDSFAKVWKVNRRACKIEHIASECIQDSLLVGGKFLNLCGTEFCVSTYDSTEILCFTLAKGRGEDDGDGNVI